MTHRNPAYAMPVTNVCFSSVSLSSVGCHDASLLSSIFHEPGHVDTTVDSLMVDTDTIYSVYTPAPGFAQFSVPVQELFHLSEAPGETVTLTLPEPMVTSDQDRLEILAKTWTPDMGQMLEEGAWADTELVCSEGQSLGAHRIMLAAASPFLAKCLQSVDPEDRVCLILPDFTVSDVREFLDVIYLQTSGGGRLLKYLTTRDHQDDAVCDPHEYVKHEEKVKKPPADIKIEASLENKEVPPKSIDLGDEIPEITLDDADDDCTGDKFNCEHCGKDFKHLRLLKDHVKIHDEPRFQCSAEGCDKRFHQKTNLKAHNDVVHLKSKSIPCDICCKMFYNLSQLRSHMEQHSTNKHVCEHCSGKFASSKTLREHIKFKHTDPDVLPTCTVCHKTFSTPQNLKSHFSRVHMQERNFVCNTCGKGFFEKAQLETHLSSHESVTTNLECNVCHLKFKNKKTLYYHKKRSHNPENKIHICYQCGKSYADSHHLNRHMESHGQKSSFCKICGKSFQSEQKVKAHVRKVHEKWRKSHEMSQKCVECNKTFVNFGSMKRHLKEIHKMTTTEANSVLVEKFHLDPKKHKMNPSEIRPEILT